MKLFENIKTADVTDNHVAALRSVVAMWPYQAGTYNGEFPLANVPDAVRELLAMLEGET